MLGTMSESWCVVAVDGQEFKAKIKHKGRGKFQIVESQGNLHNGKVVDASDVIYCVDPAMVKAIAVSITRKAGVIIESYLGGQIDKDRMNAELSQLIDGI